MKRIIKSITFEDYEVMADMVDNGCSDSEIASEIGLSAAELIKYKNNIIED